MIPVLLVTEPGLEEIAAEELREVTPQAGGEVVRVLAAGLVRAEAEDLASLARLRTVRHYARFLGEAGVASLDDVRREAALLAVPELEGAGSFRVTAHLGSGHPLETDAVAGAVGAALQRRYGTPVDLRGYRINVRVDLRGDRLVVSTQLTDDSFARRIRRGRALRGATRPTIAAAMLRVAGAHRGGGRLLDPMCGGGTIVAEAALANPALAVCGSDWDRKTVEAARLTARNHGLGLDLRVADARHPARVWPGSFDYVVTNPPFGQRLGRAAPSLSALYTDVLRGVLEVSLADTRIVVLTPRVKALDKACAAAGLRIARQIPIETGGIVPRLHLLARD